jgi:GAF domain-containing protein
MNHLHKWHLVEAERMRVLGKVHNAMAHYDRAIELAGEHGYLHEEALANELAAKCYLAQGRNRLARMYLLEARYCYRKWGAIAKVRHLEHTYPQLLAAASDHRTATTIGNTPPPSTDTTTTSSGALDLATVLKAAQAISSEIDLDTLLMRLIEIVIENTGRRERHAPAR